MLVVFDEVISRVQRECDVFTVYGRSVSVPLKEPFFCQPGK